MQNFIRPIAGIFFGVAAITMNAADPTAAMLRGPTIRATTLN